MAAAVARYPSMLGRSSTPPPHLSLNTSSRGTPTAIPNKHIPECSPGGLPATPPASPPRQDSLIEQSSITYPPDAYCSLYSDDPPVYTITADRMAEALEHTATQPLPNPDQVFPWMHGLHSENQIQLAFFSSRRRSGRKVPRCIRSITVVKTGGNLSSSKLKGAVAPDELLESVSSDTPRFMECDPKDGFSVRNFQIQACKLAMVSDIIVYGDHKTNPQDTVALAQKISQAQRQYEARNGFPHCLFNTFMLSDPFASMQEKYPKLVAINSAGDMTGEVADFFYWERYEMSAMSKATEISNNVFLGPTPDQALHPDCAGEDAYDMLIEATDLAHVPESRSLRALRMGLERVHRKSTLHMEFPSSGSIMPPTWAHGEVDGLMDMCKWMYELANPQEVRRSKRRREEEDEAIEMDDIAAPRKFLIHCTDGYTETTLLALAYFMYAEGLPVHDAWIQMHREKGRNFFAYPSDVALLTAIQPRILQESPRFNQSILNISEPRWLSKLDGSLPSRILPYMYLGNLGHANNPELLRAIGITRILSVGEALSWPEDVTKKLDWPAENFLMIDRVQDNGVDPLWGEFERCLKFIEAGKQEGGATLVHCRVGVSRSATICIAEVMNELGMSFPRAYCFVRARRLNVIIHWNIAMGVTGLWTVLQPCARPIKIETLNKKRLAVDASIWIYQFLKAVRDKEGNALRNSHIVGFFRRVCKLLFIGIKPVFVFDGGAPALKRQTISNRKSRREGRREDAVRTAGKLLAIQMQRAAEEEDRKRKEAARHPREEPQQQQEEEIPDNLVYAEELLQNDQERAQNRTFKRKDQYHLPDLGKSMSEMGAANDPRVMSLEELEEYARQFDRGEDINVYDFSKIDFDGHFFQSLPPADRYNILNAARLRSRLRMGHSKEQLDAMFPDRMAFSKFQIDRVRERNELTQRLMNLNGMNDDAFGAGGFNRVAGERDREYVLVKNDGVEGGWALGVVLNKEEGKAHKPINVDLPERPAEEDQEWEDDEDFEDVPIEGLNRLPKPKGGLSAQEKEGREFIANELATRRRKLYKARKEKPAQSKPQRAAPVNQDPDSLFLADDNEEEEEDWENVPMDGVNDMDDAGDDIENEQLQQAIALSMQPEKQDVADESEGDPVREVFEQRRAAEANPFAGTKGSGMAIARLANQRSNKLAPKGPFEGSDSEDDMDLQAALAESRKSKRPVKPRQSSPKQQDSTPAPAVKPATKPKNAAGFDGPLPFERLNLGNSLLGKKKMDKLEADNAGGFEKDYGQEKKSAAPLPPWFSGQRDIAKEVNAQREEEKQQWEEARQEEKSRFQFQQLPSLRKPETKEIIDLDAPASQSQKQVVAIDSDEEADAQMEDVPIEDPELRMGDLADKIKAEPPKPLSPQQKSPPRQDPALTKKTPFADDSDDEPVDWSESEPEEEKRAQQKATDGEKSESLAKQPSRSPSQGSEEFEDVPMQTETNVLPEPTKSPSPEFEDVPMQSESVAEAVPPKSPSPVFEDVPIRQQRPHRPQRELSPLQGPDDLTKPIVPHSGVADDNAHFEMPEGNESDQYSDPEDEELFASLAKEAEEHARFAQEVSNNTAARVNFDDELKQLRAQQKKDRRDADEVTQTMITECQHLLTLFGLPYITAPMEAEAQCAELVNLGLVDGIVTDDSDTFLFGGTRVYKNMFNAAKFVECYLAQDLTNEFSLTREKMIAIAQLLGSDYTTGIPGIGPVTALEILSEFQDLESFRTWWDGVQNGTIKKEDDAKKPFRKRFRKNQATKLFLPPTFPDPRVAEAYLHPEVDSDPEPFQWGVPDLAALRTFLSSQIGWSSERTDEVLVPVIRDMNRREKEGTQANITRFFDGSVGAGAFAPRVRNAESGPSGKKKGMSAAGKRMEAALTRLAGRGDEANDAAATEDGETEGANATASGLTGRKKRKAASKPVSLAEQEEGDAAADIEEEEEEDELYKEPTKKKPRKTRKGKTAK